jgi:hypothetical protein
MNDLVLGCDTSFHQRLVSWLGAKADGVWYAFIRFCQGGDWKDPRALESWANAKKDKVLRAPYIVWDERRGHGGRDHFRNFMEIYPKHDPGELIIKIDLELHPVTWSEFLILVEELHGFQGFDPDLYSGAWFLNQLNVPIRVQQLDHWLTGYNDHGPTMPKNYTPSVVYWQQSDSWFVDWVNA